MTTAKILKITTPFNSVLYWTGSILSNDISDAVMVSENSRIAWHDLVDFESMNRARIYFADEYDDSIVEIVNI